MAGGSQQKIFEFAEYVRADGVALVAGQHDAILALSLKHVEVVKPEIREDLLQLPVGVNRAVELGLTQVSDHHLLRRAQHDVHAPQLGLAGHRIQRKRGGHLFEPGGVQRREEGGALLRRAVQRDLHLPRFE